MSEEKPWEWCCGDGGVVPPLFHPPVRFEYRQRMLVVLDNGLLQVTLTNPGGIVIGIAYNGLDNLLEVQKAEINRGYSDLFWNDPTTPGTFDVIRGTSFRVIVEDDDQVELSFIREWDPSLKGKAAPLNIDRRFVMLRGSSGFYMYTIYEHMNDWPGFSMGEMRITFNLNKQWFQYMAIADERQRQMPLWEDRMPGRCEVLAYPEAVLLTDPVDSNLKGEVDDKYQYSCDNKDIKVHGWISTSQRTGFWQITPSFEYRSGGPVKQNLTSHVGPTSLSMYHSAHYEGDPLVPKWNDGEPWKKVFGPVFIYLNSMHDEGDWHWLWEDAKCDGPELVSRETKVPSESKCSGIPIGQDMADCLDRDTKQQMMMETKMWPYSFLASEDYPKPYQRGSVKGRLLVQDRYVKDEYILASGAYVGLALPGIAGSWQTECKGYQFWTKADENGFFSISGIIEGDYNLYAWVPGFIGDYKCDAAITITSVCDMEMGDFGV